MTKISVRDIQAYLADHKENVTFSGDLDVEITGFCSLSTPESNCMTWVKHPDEKSLSKFEGCSDCLIVTKKIIPIQMKKVCFLITAEPKKVFFRILRQFWSSNRNCGIALSSVIHTDKIAKNATIGENCYIGEDVTIGKGTVIEHNVSIYHNVSIGENCIIHSGAVIGADGFGYFITEDGRPDKVEHFGGVVIGDEVEIGANACIDRGTIDNTVIKSHSKIDNLVHIAHNVQVGESSMIVAGAIVCGSAKLDDESYVAPGGIIKNQLKIGKNSFVGMGAVVTRPVEDDTVVTGIPAKAVRKVQRGDK